MTGIRFKVEFPFPDEDDRQRLWERMIPEEAEVNGKIDFAKLAKEFRLAVGNIKNEVVRAAFAAAEQSTGLSNALLLDAARAEAREMGQLVREKAPQAPSVVASTLKHR